MDRIADKARGTAATAVAAIVLVLMASGQARAAPGDIYVVDRTDGGYDPFGGVIRVDPATGVRTVVSNNAAVDGQPYFVDPAGIALEADGDILVADYSAIGLEGAVIRVDPVTGVRSTVSSNISPTGNPEFVDPQGIAVDSNGDILVADYGAFGGSGGVIRVDPVTGARSIDSSNTSPPGGPSFVDPIGITLAADGNILVTDLAGGSGGTGRVIRVSNPGSGNRTLVSSNSAPSGSPTLIDPNGIVAEADGNILLADFTAYSDAGGGVIGVSPTSGARSTVSANSAPGGTPVFIDPQGIALEQGGNILVADSSAFGGPGGIIGVVRATGVRSTVSANGFPGGGPSFADPIDLAVVPPAAGGDGGTGGGDGGAGGGDSGGNAEAGAPGVAYIDNDSARLKRGKFPLEIGCEAGGSDCDGGVTLKAAKRTRRSDDASAAASRMVTLASVPIAVPGGQTETLKAKLSRKGRRLFERRRSVKVEASILTTGAAGDRTATDTLKVKRKR